MTTNPIHVFDFTAKADTNDKNSIIESLNAHCKNWVFQLEKGAQTGYLHFQGRCSFKVKRRNGKILNLKDAHFSPTFTDTAITQNFNYVIKEETRVEGPWSDKDTIEYVPLQYRNKMETLKPFQTKVIELAEKFDDRKINLIYCPNGNKGKSTLAHLCRIYLGGIVLPPLNDADKLVFSCCNILMAKHIRKSVPIFIDLPRAMCKERLHGLYTAIEVIKAGWVYDTRNHWKEWDFDSPSVWVFTNTEPDLNMVSLDRWNIWTINEEEDLVEFKAQSCNNINSTKLEHLEHFDFLSYDNSNL